MYISSQVKLRLNLLRVISLYVFRNTVTLKKCSFFMGENKKIHRKKKKSGTFEIQMFLLKGKQSPTF